MPEFDKSKKDDVLKKVRIEKEKRQNALNYKRTQLRILPKEIEAIEERIKILNAIESYFEEM